MTEASGPDEPEGIDQPSPDDQHGGSVKPWFPPDPEGQPGAGPYGQWAPPHGTQPGPGPYGQPQPGPYGQPQPGPYGPPGPGPYGQPGPAPYGQQGAPYGYHPSYGSPPAPKPGVIPLRPIGAGEILDGAFTAIRRNPGATLGIGAVIMTIYGIVAAIIAPAAVTGFGSLTSISVGQQESQAQLQQQVSNLGREMLGLALIYLLLYVAGQILTGMLTVVIGRSVLGDRITAGEAWRRTLPRLPAIFGATILFVLTIAGVWVVYLGIGLAISAIGNGPGPVVAVYFAVGAIVAICLTVWFWTSFVLANQIVVLERTGPARALGRSWRLVRHSFWRVFGVTLLAGLIAGVAGLILQLPFTIPAAVMAAHSTGSLHPSIIAVIIGTVGTIVSRTLTGALLAGVYVLLYIDLRMRREGLDMALRTAADGERATGDEFATVWRPPAGSPPPGQAPPGPSQGHGTGPGRW
jgi:hypothetical protein